MPITNPLPEVLELIPYTDTVLDPSLIDKIGIVMLKCGYNTITSNLVLLLLSHLALSHVIQMKVLKLPSVLGDLIIISRNLDGREKTN